MNFLLGLLSSILGSSVATAVTGVVSSVSAITAGEAIAAGAVVAGAATVSAVAESATENNRKAAKIRQNTSEKLEISAKHYEKRKKELTNREKMVEACLDNAFNGAIDLLNKNTARRKKYENFSRRYRK